VRPCHSDRKTPVPPSPREATVAIARIGGSRKPCAATRHRDLGPCWWPLESPCGWPSRFPVGGRAGSPPMITGALRGCSRVRPSRRGGGRPRRAEEEKQSAGSARARRGQAPTGIADGHRPGALAATGEDFQWPPAGRSRWPPTAHPPPRSNGSTGKPTGAKVTTCLQCHGGGVVP
jgi:hypothetical protein